MQQPFEERYLAILQNVEAAIIGVYRDRPTLLDSEVDGALEALVARYTAEGRGRTPPSAHLDAVRQEVYEAVAEVCEWRLGRAAFAGVPPVEPATGIDELAACLKRIRKSIARMTKEGGRQGYLKFASRFL